MSSQEDHAAKRRRLQGELLRPGIGSSDLQDYGLGTPVQPQYEAIGVTTAELLQVIQKVNPATILSQHRQLISAANTC